MIEKNFFKFGAEGCEFSKLTFFLNSERSGQFVILLSEDFNDQLECQVEQIIGM
jgi:hypothetical protein